MLQYNTIVYLPLEDLSFFKVMIFRPDKNAYLVESCDPELSFGNYYKNILVSEIPEKMIINKKDMEEFWEKETEKLTSKLKELKQQQFSPEYALIAKLKDLDDEIQKNQSKLTPDLSDEEKQRIEKVIRQLQKGARRTENKQSVKYKKFAQELDRQIRRTEAKIEKYKKDREKLTVLEKSK